MSPNPEYLTINQVTELLQISKATVNRMLRDGRLPSYVVGKRRLIAKVDIDRYMESCRQEVVRQK